jgi:small GTP-binding protein
VIAGEPTVGKTQLIHQSLKSVFNHNYMMTQGCEYSCKEVKGDKSYFSVELHLLDIAGQNIFKEITFDLLWKANQVALVYDVTNPDSFHLLRQWYEGIKQQNPGKKLSGVLIANKIDLETRAAVST